ncbi:MAG: NAD(+) synthase [Bacteroidales bacterium]|nr:NAD(+) synthase [Bacteroidales bacterium]
MFNAIKVKDKLVQWIRDWFEENGKDCNAVIGISGGKDSTVVAALCVEALGKDRVFGVLMPNVIQKDIIDSYAVVEYLDINFMTVDIGLAVDSILCGISYPKNGKGLMISNQTRVNLPCRIRMSTLYAVSQSMNGRVANTCNLSEDYVGYSTRWGDSVGDFAPLANLTTDEVVAIGDALGLPYDLVHKTPTDGLCGKTDEDNLGFTYAVLNKYIRTGVCEDEEAKRLIDEKHEKNLFKLQPIPSFEFNNYE